MGSVGDFQKRKDRSLLAAQEEASLVSKHAKRTSAPPAVKVEGDLSMSALPSAAEAVRCVESIRCGWRVSAQPPVARHVSDSKSAAEWPVSHVICPLCYVSILAGTAGTAYHLLAFVPSFVSYPVLIPPLLCAPRDQMNYGWKQEQARGERSSVTPLVISLFTDARKGHAHAIKREPQWTGAETLWCSGGFFSWGNLHG